LPGDRFFRAVAFDAVFCFSGTAFLFRGDFAEAAVLLVVAMTMTPSQQRVCRSEGA
jgi:hypothetical protein